MGERQGSVSDSNPLVVIDTNVLIRIVKILQLRNEADPDDARADVIRGLYRIQSMLVHSAGAVYLDADTARAAITATAHLDAETARAATAATAHLGPDAVRAAIMATAHLDAGTDRAATIQTLRLAAELGNLEKTSLGTTNARRVRSRATARRVADILARHEEGANPLEEALTMSCTSCGQAIPTSESSAPCPCCGSVDRNVTAADYAAATDEIAAMDIVFPPAPAAWQAMWAEVHETLASLRGWYGGGQGMNVTKLRAASAAFFVSCFSLKDHLKADPAVPQQVRAEVEGYVRYNPSLALAGDIANTYKHGGRDPGKRACSITEAAVRPTGSTVTFGWTDDLGRLCHGDCLDLAEKAAQAWNIFLYGHNLLGL
jgi:rubrerythrin